jgi:hypothetical protein
MRITTWKQVAPRRRPGDTVTRGNGSGSSGPRTSGGVAALRAGARRRVGVSVAACRLLGLSVQLVVGLRVPGYSLRFFFIYLFKLCLYFFLLKNYYILYNLFYH